MLHGTGKAWLFVGAVIGGSMMFDSQMRRSLMTGCQKQGQQLLSEYFSETSKTAHTMAKWSSLQRLMLQYRLPTRDGWTSAWAQGNFVSKWKKLKEEIEGAKARSQNSDLHNLVSFLEVGLPIEQLTWEDVNTQLSYHNLKFLEVDPKDFIFPGDCLKTRLAAFNMLILETEDLETGERDLHEKILDFSTHLHLQAVELSKSWDL